MVKPTARRELPKAIPLPSRNPHKITKETRLLPSGFSITIGRDSYIAYNIPGYGSCFFHCLSLAMHGNFSHTQQYREQVCGYVASNWALLACSVGLFHDPLYNKEKCIRSMVYGNG